MIGIEIAKDVVELAETYFFKDEDQDGYYNYEDCDDLDPAINPAAVEVCDGVDNNCDGQVNENLTLFAYYLDGDNDGFGDLANRLDTCITVPPMGYVANFDDCDDLRSEVNPALSEVCDGLDNDCSGIIDDGLPLNRYYFDEDSDGFGNAGIFIDTCLMVPPAGYTTSDDDCNDQNGMINPSISEICDGIDNDCTGISDDNLPLNRYYFDADNDGFGDPDLFLDTCLNVPPSLFVDNNLDCNDNNLDINPDIIEVCDGIDNNCNGLFDDGIPKNRYYFDNDNDGYGNADMFIDTCLTIPPFDFVVDNTDCNDDNASINPGASEIADNGIDEDCSGLDLFLESKVFPNPFDNTLTLHFAGQNVVWVSFYDIQGREIWRNRIILTFNRTTIRPRELPHGLYFLIVNDQDGEELYSTTIVKS